MYITAAGTGMLVLNSHKAANDLLERRAHIYSDRPRLISKYWSVNGAWRMLTGFVPQKTSGQRATHFRSRIVNNQVRRNVRAFVPFSRESCLDIGPLRFEVGRE